MSLDALQDALWDAAMTDHIPALMRVGGTSLKGR
jgi:hypothetical protein